MCTLFMKLKENPSYVTILYVSKAAYEEYDKNVLITVWFEVIF